jgi:streptogramin lyase
MIAALFAAIATASLAGCGGSVQSSTPPPPPSGSYSGVSFTGTVKSGTQPLVGSSVLLYATGISGNGSSGSSMLGTALTTDSTGSFTVPAAYPCPSATSQLYLVARGGHIGSAAANSAIALITAIGPCNQVTASAHYTVNEVTTVATTWALSQFLSTGGNLGASATNSTGFGNAVSIAASLANPATGATPGATFPANGTAPTARINSLANLLNTCTSAVSSAASCSTLLGTNTNTLDAILRIVRSPASNVAALYTLSLTSTAFSPALTKAPSDWTLFINFTGGGMDYPTGLGVDSSGNIWVASYFSAGNTNASVASVTEFSPVGTPLFPNGITGSGLNSIYGLAIDASNNVWVTNQASASSINRGLGSVTVLNSAGQPISGTTGFTTGTLDFPSAVAIDPDGSAWIVNNGNSSVSRLSLSGTSLTGTTGYGAKTIAFPIAIAVDATHHAWVGDQNDGVVNRLSQDGPSITPYTCCSAPNSLALDQSGNLWAANYGGASVSEISSTGSIISSGYTGNGNFNGPQGIAVDGSGNVWVGNFHAPILTELAGASSTSPAPGQPISPASGWAPEAGLFGSYAAAIDASGNLWITNLFSNSIEEFVGIATPVKTPVIGPPQTP